GATANAAQLYNKGPDNVAAKDFYPTSLISAATANAPPQAQAVGLAADVLINHSLSIAGASTVAKLANTYLSTVPTWVNDVNSAWSFECVSDQDRREYEEQQQQKRRAK